MWFLFFKWSFTDREWSVIKVLQLEIILQQPFDNNSSMSLSRHRCLIYSLFIQEFINSYLCPKQNSARWMSFQKLFQVRLICCPCFWFLVASFETSHYFLSSLRFLYSSCFVVFIWFLVLFNFSNTLCLRFCFILFTCVDKNFLLILHLFCLHFFRLWVFDYCL